MRCRGRAATNWANESTILMQTPTNQSSSARQTEWCARRPVVLVACAARKRDKPSPARDLYTSALFRSAPAYAERVIKPNGAWFILSDKHGLLAPEAVVAPYDQSIRDMTRAERERWQSNVASTLQAHTNPSRDALIFLAGVRYYDQMRNTLERAGYHIVTRCKGCGSGNNSTGSSRPIRLNNDHQTDRTWQATHEKR